MEPWFDTHVHLDRYSPEERIRICAVARAAGVRLVAVAVDMDSSVAVIELEEAVIAGRTVGIHPTRAERWFEHSLAHFAEEPGVAGIGECGFDDAGPDFEIQQWAFEAQCRVARLRNLALVLHVDGATAWDRLVLAEDGLNGLRVVRHYFTGDAAQAAWHAERGHWLSFGNPLRRDASLRAIAREYPAERLLIETDSYPLPGRNTEPKHVVAIGETLALLRDWTFDEARERLCENTLAAFSRQSPGQSSNVFSTP